MSTTHINEIFKRANRYVHRQFIEDRRDHTPLEINNGYCYLWTSMVCRLIPDAVEMASADVDVSIGHVWIKHKDKHYDAECHEGVMNWQDLPIFKR